MSADRIGELARGLGEAWANARTVPAPSTVEPSLTLEDAYRIQELVIDARMAAGRRLAGWKLGLTSAPPPATPIVGTLLDDMVLPSGATVSLAGMVAPMVEAEVVIRLGETIDGAVTIEQLQQGPHEVGPGIEVIDYRTTGSEGVIDWVADNSTVAYGVVGPFTPVAAIDPAGVEASLWCAGDHLAAGRGDQVMGNPLAAVAWLSQHLVERGRTLERGQVVLTGSLTGHHRVDRAVACAADFGDLGAVSVRFED